MNDYDSILRRMAEPAVEPGGYTGEDGLLYCGKCHTPKQFPTDKPPLAGQLLPRVCQCEQVRREQENAEREVQRHDQAVADLKRKGFTDPAMPESMIGCLLCARPFDSPERISGK